ncbi:unnamed protein product, partial [marine sediment metagenome]
GYRDPSGIGTNRYVARYNIAEGVWSNVYDWDPAAHANALHGAAWDGAYNLWLMHAIVGDELYKKINLFDESVADWPVDPVWLAQPNALTMDFWTGILIGGGLTGIGNYSYATKALGVIPDNALGAVSGRWMIVAPPWAVNDPGCIFAARSNAHLDFFRYSYTAGWAARANLPLNPSLSSGLVWADGSGTEYIYPKIRFPRFCCTIEPINSIISLANPINIIISIPGDIIMRI